MGESVLAGLIGDDGADEWQVRATCHSLARAAELRRIRDVEIEAIGAAPDANRRAAAADAVIIAVPPDRVLDLLEEISGSLRPGAVVVSLAAGVTLTQLKRSAPAAVAVLRALPNIGGTVRSGITGIGAHDACAEETLRAVRRIFETIGTVRDEQLEALSAISGSGPAYFYYLSEQLSAAALDLGFSAEQATRLAEDTFVGAAAALRESGESSGELLRRLATPPSATIRAVNALSSVGLKDALLDAAAASAARAREMAAEAEPDGPR